MILDQWNKDAFKGYAKPLEKLEKAFKKAGRPISFYAFVAPLGIKMVRVIGNRGSQKVFCIEWASPAQAAKIVAAGVRA